MEENVNIPNGTPVNHNGVQVGSWENGAIKFNKSNEAKELISTYLDQEFFGASSRKIGQIKTDYGMVKYEYMILDFEETKNMEFVTAALNRAGEQGWELVAIDTGNNYLRKYFFKRAYTDQII